MISNYDEWLKFAKELAIKAGELIVSARDSEAFIRNYKADHELVTSTDLAVDQYLCLSIVERYPAHKILSEESSPGLDLTSIGINVPVWVIDPIDGTVNYAHGHHHVAVSIGLYIGRQRILGVVYAPFLDECFWAVSGQGASLNGRRLAVSGAQNLRNALVGTGFPYQKTDLLPIMTRISNVLHQCQDIRRNGSAALDLCWVAAGRLDAYFESVKPWDMAAGALIAEEAGATIGRYSAKTGQWPDVVDGEFLLVSTPALFVDLSVLLALAE